MRRGPSAFNLAAVGLAGAVVGVLPKQQHLHLLERRGLERREHLVGRRVDRPGGPLVGDVLLQLLEVRFGELGRQGLLPVGRQLVLE